ncbi:MAG: alpha/beta hydrolase [Deltaproteobacteria bacterium]|nr:alpha/beta hydrolase [Deltaproteobacteria bacterium]
MSQPLLACLLTLSLLPLTSPEAKPPAPESPMTLSRPDGRSLAWREVGPPEGRPVFFFHGGADTGLAAQLLLEAAETTGTRIIAPDRPGFGASSAHPERGLRSWASDVGVLADHLRVARFDLIGHSGGGPHALAVAALLPDRVDRVALVAGGAPKDAAPKGMALPFRLNRWFAISSPGMQRRFVESHRSGLQNPERFLSQWGRMSRADGALFVDQPEVASLIIEEMTQAYSGGIDGPALEGRLYYQDWGFELGEVHQKVDLFYGDADPMAPVGWGEYFEERLPSATLHILAGEGHFSGLVHYARRILDSLRAIEPAL